MLFVILDTNKNSDFKVLDGLLICRYFSSQGRVWKSQMINVLFFDLIFSVQKSIKSIQLDTSFRKLGWSCGRLRVVVLDIKNFS